VGIRGKWVRSTQVAAVAELRSRNEERKRKWIMWILK